MRFASYTTGGASGWGLLVDGGVLDGRQLGEALPPTLREFIAQCAAQPQLLAAVAARAKLATPSPLGAVTLAPCVPDPGKIICLGVNYVDHAKEGGNAIADFPAFFLRCNTSLLAHGAPLQVSPTSDKLDFEAELAVVIGQRTRFVSEADAMKSVFGYACFNDGSYRDYQRKASQWTIGKNFDASGGFGPCLVTADELPAGGVGLRIQSILNGKIMQDANTSDMVFGVARTIALLSQCLTLEPGDVLVMGTPGGVGYARTPPVWMKAGDTIDISIQGIGVLSNPVTA
jgi:2-keto-4-pentenoate hydratase/2-oxohepta-3-ene-1,7-dioic acid hydratase in catechol pathway